ncbi:MAG: hypothetical protein J7493_01870 [Porphyrobacter sp.]|nr:hypothetical protein [Porphyrobacter sp.]
MNIRIAVLAAALTVSVPAAANDFRAEARGGMTFGNDQTSEALIGVAGGYDLDISENAFAGVEASVDKVLVDGSGVILGGTARLGLKSGGVKAYIDGGYSYLTCDLCGDAVHAGLGVELPISGRVYGKVGYRYFFFDGTDSNLATAGIGMRF